MGIDGYQLHQMPLVDPELRNGRAVLISELGGFVDSTSRSDLEVTTTDAMLYNVLDLGEEGRQRS